MKTNIRKTISIFVIGLLALGMCFAYADDAMPDAQAAQQQMQQQMQQQDDTQAMPADMPQASDMQTQTVDEQAAQPPSIASTITDPTLAFFVALHTCTAGDYQEKNVMSAIVGPTMLQQKIVGPDQDGNCSATLQTPDGRTLQCTFSQQTLDQLADQHFMTGVLNATTDNPSADSQRSDMIWTQMKEQSCNFAN